MGSLPPNIVLVVCDTLGATHVSLYGYPRVTTPKLEKLVERKGFTIFTRCYSTSCWTSPAHASLFTGLYPREHGVHEGNMCLGNRVISLAEVLEWSGYDTLGISCNAVIDTFMGFGRGFRRFITVGGRYIFPETDPDISALKRFVTERGGGKWTKAFNSIRWSLAHRTFSPLVKKMVNKLYKELVLKRRGLRLDATPFTRKALGYSLNYVRQASSPFFLFLNIMQTHHNYNPPAGFRHTWSAPNSPYKKLPQDFLNHYYKEPYPLEAIEYFRDLYDEEVLFLDHVLSDFVDQVLSNSENTLVIITSDHGEHFGESGHYGHILSLADPVTWIPMIVKFPGGRFEVCDRMVQLNDVVATIIDLLDLPMPTPSSSNSFLSSPGRQEAFMEIVCPHRWLERVKPGAFKERLSKGPFTRRIEV